MAHKWRFIKMTDDATVYVDYESRMTKIVTENYIYIHKGIYPDQKYTSMRKFKR